MELAKALVFAVGIGIVAGTCVSCLPADGRQEMDAPGCDLTVRFSNETRDAGRLALARVNETTGCDVHEDIEGVPVSTEKVLVNEDGSPACGQTSVARYSDGVLAYVEKIQLSTEVDGCNSDEAILIHEIFHAMLATSDVHAPDGVFHSHSGNGELINASTLETVCAHMDCPSFSPES